MRRLGLHNIDKIDHLVQPEECEEIGLSSPALSIFTDFKKHKPLMIDSQTTAVEAEKEMIRTHVKMKLVVDSRKEFVGVVSYDDIAAQNVVKMVANGFTHSEILVEDLMRPRSTVQALSYQDIKRASIGDMVETLKQNGVQHCLVIDQELHQIRGLVSASDIARKLKLSIDIQKAPSFVDIFRVVRGISA